MDNHTPKQFVLQLGSLVSLYLSLSFFLVLVFGFITILFPDPINGIWEVESAASSIRLGFAMVLVFLPTYLILTRIVNKGRRTSSSSYLGLTKWLIYLSLLIGGFVLLGDLVAVIMGFLEGELTARFILKAVAVFTVTGAAFYYYVLDARGYWIKHERQSLIYGIVAAGLITITLVAALLQIPDPAKVRAMKVDQEMVNTLQDMQWRIEDYYRTNKSLPADLPTLYGEFDVPTAPENKPAYVYEVTGDTTYKLCADFNYDIYDFGRGNTAPRVALAPGLRSNYNWDYKAGEWCFNRVIEEETKQ